MIVVVINRELALGSTKKRKKEKQHLCIITQSYNLGE